MSDERRSKKFASSLKNVGFESVSATEEELTFESIEERLNIDLRTADPRQLLHYFANCYKFVHGFEYKIEGAKEYAILRSFKERYGPDAGLMVRCLFEVYHGRWGGQIVGIASVFSKGSKWITDQLYAEVKQAEQKSEKRTVSEGMMTSDDFLNRFS